MLKSESRDGLTPADPPALAPLPELRSHAVGGRQQAWREAGNGPALVLVHGIGGSSRSWLTQFGTFSQSFRVIAWDAPGYGRSEGLAADAPRVTDYSECLGHLLAVLGVNEAHFVAHSLGAVIVAALVGSGTISASSVTLVHGVPGGGRLDPAQRNQQRLARRADLQALGSKEFAHRRGSTIIGPNASAEAVKTAIEIMSEVPERAYLQAWEMMCVSDLFTFLGNISCPALVVGGDSDPVAPPSVCREIANAIPQADLKILPGVGHYALLETPDLFNGLLAGFLSSAGRAPCRMGKR